MPNDSQISSHTLTPRWTHAIDIRAVSRRDDSITLQAIGLTLLAVLRDQAVPLAPVPRADLPRRTPTRPPTVPARVPSPLHVPQEIEDRPEQLYTATGTKASSTGN